MSSETFKAGDRVRWRSQANGRSKKKIGMVVAVVPHGTCPGEIRPYVLDNAVLMFDAGSMARYATSYLVEVPGPTPRSKPRLYWPRASKLERAEDG